MVGSGPAGISFVQRLIGSRLKVLLLEAGRARETSNGRDDFVGSVEPSSSHAALDLYRVRALGGTSAIWGGRAIAFDPIDFERRSWVKGSGWPLGYSDVAPFYPDAFGVCEAGSGDDDPYVALPGQQGDLIKGLEGNLIRTTLERFSRPTNFWTRFQTTFLADPDVHVLCDATAVHVRLTRSGSSVTSLEVDHGGVLYQIRAQAFVLAGGGFETPRLLLNSDDVCRTGVGNQFDQVGRYYMGHLCGTLGRAKVHAEIDVANGYDVDADGIYVRRRLALTDDAQRQFGLLNTTFRLHHPEPADPSHADPVLSAMFFAKACVRREYAARFGQRPSETSAMLRHVGNIARGLPSLAGFTRTWVRDRLLADRKLPSVVRGPHHGGYAIEFHSEQSPNVRSGLSLQEDRDRHGMRRLHVDWRCDDNDIEALKRAYSVLSHELCATGTGHLDVDLSELADCAISSGGLTGHHIGTTRMSADPRTGVVDQNCRVHGIANLYIAGSSVFPTSSQANPTLTIIALALRLADHVRATLSRSDFNAITPTSFVRSGVAA